LANFDNIVEQGFDIRVSNMGGALGAGTYFAADASYSDMYSRRAAPNAGAGLGMMPRLAMRGMLAGGYPYGALATATAQHGTKGSKRHGKHHAHASGLQQQQEEERKHEWVGQYAMLMCRVALGRIGMGGSSMRKPPDGFDSVSATGSAKPQAGDIFAVYDNAQAYPEYIIHYDA
jgi:hypothetical protein